jgi:2-haloacid dehalogenase
VEGEMKMGIKALLFDVFGTVVDYRSTIVKEGEGWNQRKGLEIDWAMFSDAWRSRYRPTMDRVLRKEIPWMNLDDLHHMILKELLLEFDISGLSDEEIEHLNYVWHRLEPWGDAVPGLHLLKQKFIISPLSNGNVALLTNMAKHTGLPWDVIISPEFIQSYKPDPKVYLAAVNWLGLKPEEVMMVATHQYDLQAAQALGLKTAYVLRPLEYGYENIPDLKPTGIYDVIARDFVDLAQQLGCSTAK